MKTNAPVTASFNSRLQTYRFELPFMYSSRSQRTLNPTYTLFLQHATDRYVPDVINQWDCKPRRRQRRHVPVHDLRNSDAAPQCATRSRNTTDLWRLRYLILSDGKEAMTSTRLSFGGDAAKEGIHRQGRKPTALPIQHQRLPSRTRHHVKSGKFLPPQ